MAAGSAFSVAPGEDIKSSIPPRTNRQLSRRGQLMVRVFAEAFTEFAEDPQ